MKLDEIRRIQKSGIYCLRNDQEKKVQIFSTKCILEHLNYTLKNGEYSQYENLVFEVLEDDLSNLELKVLWGNWIEFYKQQNYSLYKEILYPKYIVKEGLQLFDKQYYSSIYIQNTRRDKIVLGLFDNIKDSKQWLDLNYPDRKISYLLFSDNNLTVKYLNSLK